MEKGRGCGNKLMQLQPLGSWQQRQKHARKNTFSLMNGAKWCNQYVKDGEHVTVSHLAQNQLKRDQKVREKTWNFETARKRQGKHFKT